MFFHFQPHPKYANVCIYIYISICICIYIYISLHITAFSSASVFDGTVGDFASHTVKEPAGAGAHRGPRIRIARAAKGEN